MTTIAFPTLDMIPATYHKDAVLIRYRRAITDERLDQMHDRVQRDLLELLNNGTFNEQAYKVALIEADRAYGARQEEFDNPSASLLEKRAQHAVGATASGITAQKSVVDVSPARKALSVSNQRGSRPLRGSLLRSKSTSISKPVAAMQQASASKPNSSWATAEQDLKRLLNQMQ